MLSLLAISALAALLNPVNSYAVKRDSDISVQLNAIGNSQVEAVVTNHAANDVSMFVGNNILDSAPVKKATVFKGGMQSFRCTPTHFTAD